MSVEAIRADVGVAAPAPVEHWPTRLRWWLQDALVLTRRGLIRIRHEPLQLSDVTVSPLILVLLFAYIFGGSIPIAGGYREFLIGGMFALTATNTLTGSAVGIVSDMTSGVVDRFRSLPMSRAGVLTGSSFAAMCKNVIGIVIVTVTGLAIGWGIHRGVGHAAIAFGLVLLFSYAITWMGACFGMMGKDVESVQASVFTLWVPITFVSNAFVLTSGMPSWLETIANWNPISAVAAACRAQFGNPNPSANIDSWPMQHPELATLGWSVLLIAVFAPLAVRLYGKRASK